MKIKQIAIISLSPFLLTGCFGGDNTEVTTSNLYQESDFSISVAKDWVTIERGDFTSNISPKTAVGFRSNLRNEVFTSNVNIVITSIDKEITAGDFAKSNLSKIRSSLLSYQEGSTSAITIPFGDAESNGYKVQFSGKQGPSQPIVQFDQVYAVNNGLAYQVTGAYLATEDESVVKQIGEMLDSFSLR